MSGSGEQGAQPAPGLLAAAANRRDEEADAAPGESERERGAEVEVIALSARSLMSPTRFACEACGKGFQREQNLHLHRRGHGHARDGDGEPRLPRNGSTRRRAYVCSEASCPRHDPAGALADLAGIKRHYRRRHREEKKWKCGLCGWRYAAHGDWEAHARVCVGQEYRCECGHVFSRQDRGSFIKPRAFCDTLAPFMEAEATLTSALHSLTPPSQDDGHGNAAGASGFGMGTKHLNLWEAVAGADGSSSSRGGFAHGPFERGDGRRGCTADACTRPELPPWTSLSRPVLEAAARAHAVANEHACERCREFLKADKGW